MGLHRRRGGAGRGHLAGGGVNAANLKPFFVVAFGQAIELGIATHADVIRHVTPDVLAAHLPRPLWARVIAACLGAKATDAKLVVETITLVELAEHIPHTILWACLHEIGTRALGGTSTYVAPPKPIPLAVAPPPEILAAGTGTTPVTATQPSPVVIPEPEPVAAPPSASRTRTATSQRGFRPSSTNIGRLANSGPATPPPASTASTSASATRRPQASAAANPPSHDDTNPPTERKGARATTANDFDVNVDDWKSALAVEDEQLVDWSSSEETVTGASATATDESSRKR